MKGRFVKMLPYLSKSRDIGKVLELRFVFQPETAVDRGMSSDNAAIVELANCGLAYGHPLAISFSSFSKPAITGSSAASPTPLTSSGRKVMLGKRPHGDATIGASQHSSPVAARRVLTPTLPVAPIPCNVAPSSSARHRSPTWVPSTPPSQRIEEGAGQDTESVATECLERSEGDVVLVTKPAGTVGAEPAALPAASTRGKGKRRA